MTDQPMSRYFELKDGTVDDTTGEKSGAGISVNVPVTVEAVSAMIGLPADRIRIISEAEYNAEYADEGDEEDD